MRIECDVNKLSIQILSQEDRDENDGFYSSDDVEVSCSLYPAIYYRDEDGQDVLDTIYLRGINEQGDDRLIQFKNMTDWVIGMKAIKEYCEYREWSFKNNIDIRRVVLK